MIQETTTALLATVTIHSVDTGVWAARDVPPQVGSNRPAPVPSAPAVPGLDRFHDLFHREHEQAVALLASSSLTDEQFRLVTRALNYPAAVLLDDTGRALNVEPPAPVLIGQDLAARYEHLRQAVGGATAISTVVPSAALGIPIVAFAVPFDTPAGRRVFSGGFDVATTPLAAFLDNVVSVHPNQAYLIDANSAVVATNLGTGAGPSLQTQNPALDGALSRNTSGFVRDGATLHFFTSHPVEGTSWRLVTAAPAAKVYAPGSQSRAASLWLLIASGPTRSAARPRRGPKRPGCRRAERGRRSQRPRWKCRCRVPARLLRDRPQSCRGTPGDTTVRPVRRGAGRPRVGTVLRAFPRLGGRGARRPP